MSNTYLNIHTPHYTYHMEIYKIKSAYNSFNFLVGDKNNPCLDCSIILDNTTKNERLNKYEYTATLNKIDA